MKKSQLLLLTDILAFICFTFLISTGVIMKFLLPPGSGRWLDVWTLNRHQWGDIHFLLALVFLSVISLHLVMHWRWIIAMTVGKLQGESRQRIVYGVVACVALLVLALAPIINFYW